MAYYYPLYFPSPYVSTPIRETFPEHHYPLEHTRHRLSHALLQPPSNHIWNPHTDVRETAKRYYIDIELPGVSSKEDLKLHWISNTTLLLEFTTRRPPIEEEEEEKKAEGETKAEGKKADDAKDGEHGKAVHHTVRERNIGLHARSFNFTVPVDQDAMTAKLHSGLLRITVPKHAEAQTEPKQVEVHHTGE